MSMVNGLPTELLAHIFYLGTRDHDPLAFPVLASHICRLWRSIAVGSPSLWTTITFSKRPPYERCKLWIERSKSRPIEIKFEVAFLDEDTVDEIDEIPDLSSHVSTILDIIVPHVMRWQKLQISVDQDVYMDNVLTRLAQCTSAPLLEVLALHNLGRSTSQSPLVPFHDNAPRLSYVLLEDVGIGWSSSLLHDLVEFALDLSGLEIDMWPTWVDFSRILRESPRLTYLELVHSGPFTDWQDEPIELPSLETFSLTSHDAIHVSSLFRLLSMPNLKNLSLDLYEGDFSEFVCQLATPPRSVLSGLRHLKIEDLSCHASTIYVMHGIHVMCEQLTNLKSIHLNNVIYKPFFTTLAFFSSGILCCPNLTAIITSGIPGREMRSLITVRATAGIPIERIAMRKDDVLDEEDERWLRENVQSFERWDDLDVYFEFLYPNLNDF